MSAALPTPPRVVLDTNVVLSALVFSGQGPARLRRAWQAGLILPLVSTATARELVRVLLALAAPGTRPRLRFRISTLQTFVDSLGPELP